MAHYAKIDENNIVTEVIVANEEYIDTLTGTWIQTSYNTVAGVHTKGGTPLRKNFAGMGYTYDAQRDAFIAPKPYDSWTLNEDSCTWDAPTPMPTDGKEYIWDEQLEVWKKLFQ